MIDLGKHRLLLATAVLPCAFGIASCSTVGSSINDEQVAETNVQVEKTSTLIETTTVTSQSTIGVDGPQDPVPYYSYNAPVGGGAFAEQVPYNALGERYGNAGEDIASSVPPMAIGKEGFVNGDNTLDCLDDRLQLTTVPTVANDAPIADGEVVVVNPPKEEIKAEEPVPAPIPEPVAEPVPEPVAEPTLAADDDALTLRGAIEGEIEQSVPVEDWLAPEGASLRSLLMDWSDRSGWKVVWKSDREYILEAGAVFRGRYMDVTSALVRTFARARPAPIATFYKGNMVLLITTLEDENAD